MDSTRSGLATSTICPSSCTMKHPSVLWAPSEGCWASKVPCCSLPPCVLLSSDIQHPRVSACHCCAGISDSLHSQAGACKDGQEHLQHSLSIGDIFIRIVKCHTFFNLLNAGNHFLKLVFSYAGDNMDWRCLFIFFSFAKWEILCYIWIRNPSSEILPGFIFYVLRDYS